MAYYRSVICGILTLVFLFFGEFGLNFLRAVVKGQMLLGDETPAVLNANSQDKNNKDTFPFNSRPISKKEYGDVALKIWVSSASHAADHHGTDNQFANLICGFLNRESCYVLNASSPGVLLEDNLKFLSQNLSDWQPDYVLLYQAYLDIHHSSRTTSQEEQKRNDAVEKSKQPRIAERIKEHLNIDEILRGTILRNYSRNYIGSSFLLATPLLSELPDSEKAIFKSRLLGMIEEVRSGGSIPILTTFASAHGDAEDEIDWEYQTWLMRYFEGYSPQRINSLIDEYNSVIRETAERNGVALIDLDEAWNAKSRNGHFDDFVHFSRSGHQQVARIIAENLEGIVK